MINAGDLRHRVTYQTASASPDTYGQPERTWVSHWTDWARVTPLKGAEAAAAKQVIAEATHTVDLRGPRVLSTQARFWWTDLAGTTHTLYIAEPPQDVDGDGSHLRMVCAERIGP